MRSSVEKNHSCVLLKKIYSISGENNRQIFSSQRPKAGGKQLIEEDAERESPFRLAGEDVADGQTSKKMPAKIRERVSASMVNS